MKNQYFGDTRDLFKYDLVTNLIKENPMLKSLTFIPMLTADDSSQHGSKINYSKATAGTKNKELVEFLTSCLIKNKREIGELHRFFEDYDFNRSVSLIIYKQGDYLDKNNREAYFADVTPSILSDAVILVDPDTGMETKSVQTKSIKHVKYSEIATIYQKMNLNAVLLIFQFIPRVNRERYFTKLISELKKRVTEQQPILFVSDHQIVFFLLTKTKQTNKIAGEIVKTYSVDYNLMYGTT